MSIERAKAYLTQKGMLDRVMEFEQSSATVELAALAVGCEPARIAKTLSFNVDGRIVLILFTGDARVDNRKFKDYFHTKPRMLAAEDAQRLIGHDVGGVCPFGINDGCEVFLDESLKRFDIVYPAAGNATSAVRLTPAELEQLCTPCTWIDVSKLPES